MPRTFEHLISKIKEENFYYKINCSYLEVYNEKINDLVIGCIDNY